MLPYFVLVICWAVERLNLRLVTVAVIVAFAYQGVYAHLAAFGVVRRAPDAPAWLNPVNTNSGNAALLNALVSTTCAEKTPQFYWNAVGAQMLWLNPPALAYAAAKQLGPRNALRCDYAAIGYYESDKDQAWRELMGRQIAYYITVDPAVHKAPQTLADQTINSLNEPIFQMIETSGLFQLQQTAADFQGVLVLERTDRMTTWRRDALLRIAGTISARLTNCARPRRRIRTTSRFGRIWRWYTNAWGISIRPKPPEHQRRNWTRITIGSTWLPRFPSGPRSDECG